MRKKTVLQKVAYEAAPESLLVGGLTAGAMLAYNRLFQKPTIDPKTRKNSKLRRFTYDATGRPRASTALIAGMALGFNANELRHIIPQFLNKIRKK